MSTDLVSNITQVLSSSLVARIASSLGLDKTPLRKRYRQVSRGFWPRSPLSFPSPQVRQRSMGL